MGLLLTTTNRVSRLAAEDVFLDLLTDGYVFVNQDLIITTANKAAATILDIELEKLKFSDVRACIPDWHEMTNGWPYSTPSLILERINNPLITHYVGATVQARIKEISLKGERHLLVGFFEYSREKEIIEERDKLRVEHERSQEAAINIMEDLDAQRKELKETNAMLASEIMKQARTELELSVHRNSLEKLVKEQTDQLVESQKQLLEKERLASLGAFAAGIAHEINNPIGAIQLTIDNATEQLNEIQSNEQLKTFSKGVFDKVSSHAKRCGRIVRGILQFARAQNTDKWPEDINKIVSRAIQNLGDSMPMLVGNVEFLAGEGIPLIPINPTAMEQALINIIKNAAEAVSEKNLRIVVQTRLTETSLLLEIEDFGKGMSEEEQLHLFDPFFTTRLNFGGTGLGMSIVHGIVTEHNASIRVKSTRGEGTLMTIDFPLSLRIQ